MSRLRHQRQGHQQGGEELAGDVAAHRDGLVNGDAGCTPADAQRRDSRVAQVVDLAAQRTQRVHQVADRALVHAGHAAEFKVAAQHRQRGVSGRMAVPALP